MVSLTGRPLPATIRSYGLSVPRRACQSVVFDRRTGQAFVAQPSGHDTVLSRVTFNGATGTVADKHVLKGGGHGSAIAFRIIDGQPWIGTQWGSPTVWVRYGGGRSETYEQAKAADRTRGIPESAGNTIVASDVDHDLLLSCTRKADANKTATFTVRRLSDPGGTPLATRTLSSARPVFQGMWISADLVFTPKGYGHANQKQTIRWWNWRTGATGEFGCRWLPSTWKVQEPEGGYSTVDAAGRTHHYLQVSARDADNKYRYFLVEFELNGDGPMPPPASYPGADKTTRWRPHLAGGATFTKITKLCLHTTETSALPSYPDFAPHLTYDPVKHVFFQHMPLNRSATTLADPNNTAVHENRDDVLQVEIIARAANPDFDDQALRDLGRLAAWLNRHWGLPLTSTVTWRKSPDAFGLRASQRLSSAGYDAYTGILGHQHVSGNDHSDPGLIDISAILRHAKSAGIQPLTGTTPKGEHIMAAGTSVWEMFKGDQVLQAGTHEIKATTAGNYTMLTGPISDVDIVTTVAYTGGENVTVQHRIVDFADGNKKTLTTRLPAPGASGCAQASFKGELPKPSGAGRSMRLRVVITTSKPITITDVQTSGWRL